MNSRAEHTGRRAGAAVAAAAVLVLALLSPGCGGGVDSGGTGATPPTLAVGPINGFGSIVVAGVHYDESLATITDDDGLAIAATALTLGSMTRIDAGPITQVGSRLQAQASAIRLTEALIGPVETVDGAAMSLRVLGQRVDVTAGTAIAPTLAGGLAGLQPGRVVAVFGLLDTAGARIVATRLEPRDGATRYVLRGSVGSVDRVTQRLVINGQPVSLAELQNLPETLAAGSLVRLKLRTTASAGVWTATELRLDGVRLPDRSNVEIEGRVSAYTSATQFSIDGTPVDASTASISGTVALGVRVEVEGRSGNGVVVARRVLVDGQDGGGSEAIELEGRITALDAGAKTFVVRGVTVSYAGSPRFIGGTAADLALNRAVNVKGQWSADRSVVLASSVHVEL